MTSRTSAAAPPPTAAGAGPVTRLTDCRHGSIVARSPWGACAVDGVEFACAVLPPGLDSPDPRPPMKGAARTARLAGKSFVRRAEQSPAVESMAGVRPHSRPRGRSTVAARACCGRGCWGGARAPAGLTGSLVPLCLGSPLCRCSRLTKRPGAKRRGVKQPGVKGRGVKRPGVKRHQVGTRRKANWCKATPRRCRA